jgi:hypothetical protein
MAMDGETHTVPAPNERLPEETAKAYAAFLCFLSLGPERTVGPAAIKCGKAEGTLRKWSERHAWMQRARDYDAMVAVQEEELKVIALRSKAVGWAERQEKLKELEWSIAEKLLAKAKALLEDPSVKWTGGDIAKALDIASKLGRLATGMETDRKELTGKDGGPVKVEVDVGPLIKRVYGERDAPPILPSAGVLGVIDVGGESEPAGLVEAAYKEKAEAPVGTPAAELTKAAADPLTLGPTVPKW